MNRYSLLLVAVLLTFTPGPARAANSASSGGWLLNGATLGSGRNALLGEFGWPGLSLTVLHGSTDRFDVGGQFAFLYGFEGMSEEGFSPGIKANAVMRLNLMHQGKFNMGLRFSPGIVAYFPSDRLYSHYYRYGYEDYYTNSRDTLVGLSLPIELVAGIVTTPQFSINFGASVPMTLFLVPDSSFVFPVQVGGGVEYKIDSAFSVTADARLGPSACMVDGGSYSRVGFKLLMGVGYHF